VNRDGANGNRMVHNEDRPKYPVQTQIGGVARARPDFAPLRTGYPMNLVPKGGHQSASSPTSLEMRQIARKWELFVSGAEVDLTESLSCYTGSLDQVQRSGN